MQVVLAAVRAHGEALEYASLRLRSLPHVVLEACQRNSAAVRFTNMCCAVNDLRSTIVHFLHAYTCFLILL